MNALRLLPVDWRIFIIVALNGAVLVILALLVVSGASVLAGQWAEVRRSHADDRTYNGIEREIDQLHGLVHRYLNQPGGDLLAEVETRRARLMQAFDTIKAPDPSTTAEFARLSGASRRFLASFDALRDITNVLRRTYDSVMLQRGPEMAGLLANLVAEVRQAQGAEKEQSFVDAPVGAGLSALIVNSQTLIAATARAREALFQGLMGLSAFYLSEDRSAAERAAANFELLRHELDGMRDVAGNSHQQVMVDALTLRVDEVAQSLQRLQDERTRQTALVVEEIDGRQKAMVEVIGRLLEASQAREAAAERVFSDTLVRLGWQLGLVSVVFLSLSAVISWLIGQSIARPLRSLRQGMTAVAAGDYDWPVGEIEAQDEIGAMARALSVFKEYAYSKRRMERERDEQERRWRMMLETSPVGVSIIRARDLARVYSNPKYDEMFGLPVEENAINWPLALSFVDERDVRRLVTTFTEIGYINGWEVLRRRYDGGEWWCQMDIRSIDYRGEPSYMVWHYDVTERRHAAQDLLAAKERAEQALAHLHEAQETLVQSEKMAALGSLVAGVAHEINTPVGITVTAASHLMDECDIISRRTQDGGLRRSDLDRFLGLATEASSRILSNAQRAAELIQSFKQVAVDQTHDDRRLFDLGQYLHEVATSLGPKLKPGGHQITIDCPPLLEVDGLPGALAQIITNLVMNSVIHGFPGQVGGRIVITVGLKGDGSGDDDEITLDYADDGAGIAADVLPRIFDPFFTTNRAGGGSGLGLNIVYNIIQQKMHGRITATSQPGHGARFTLTFPRVVTPVAEGQRPA